MNVKRQLPIFALDAHSYNFPVVALFNERNRNKLRTKKSNKNNTCDIMRDGFP